MSSAHPRQTRSLLSLNCSFLGMNHLHYCFELRFVEKSSFYIQCSTSDLEQQPPPRDLMPDALSWSCCNNSRNKVHKKCNGLKPPCSHPHQPSLWKNCLPQNQFLVPKMLGTADLEHSRNLRWKQWLWKELKWALLVTEAVSYCLRPGLPSSAFQSPGSPLL